MELLLNVNRAYWNLVFFREDLKAKDKSLQAAKDFLHNTEIMLQAGAVAKLEVSRAKLRVAERREDVVLAQARIVDAEDQLRYLIYGQGDDLLSPQSLVPADVPSVYAEQINSDEAVNFALAARPVMESQRVALESADVILATAKNQLLPQVDLAATYSLNGLGEDRHDTLYSMKTLDYHDATASLSFSVPLGNRMARSYYTKQRYQRLKALADYAVMERDLTLSVKTAIRGISTSLRSVETNLVRLEASQEQLDVEKQNYDVGRSISLDVLDAQEALQQAESALIASQIAFRLSLAEYYRQTGKILEIHDVIVESDSSITAPDLETR
jgi:outer membrane protein TolC